jgi:hypothetical protein
MEIILDCLSRASANGSILLWYAEAKRWRPGHFRGRARNATILERPIGFPPVGRSLQWKSAMSRPLERKTPLSRKLEAGPERRF